MASVLWRIVRREVVKSSHRLSGLGFNVRQTGN